MRVNYKRLLLGTTLLILPLACAAYAKGGHDGEDCRDGSETEYRWDLVNINFTSSENAPGGTGSALANDGSKITFTGHGTFVTSEPGEVTGGGTWTTVSMSGAVATGTYRVTELVRFTVAPGRLNATIIDEIPGATGDRTDTRAGLLFVKIAYSDGSKGILVVSCNLSGPMSIFEGITASKGYVDYWNRLAPMPKVNGNRTLFHVHTKEDEDAN